MKEWVLFGWGFLTSTGTEAVWFKFRRSLQGASCASWKELKEKVMIFRVCKSYPNCKTKYHIYVLMDYTPGFYVLLTDLRSSYM